MTEHVTSDERAARKLPARSTLTVAASAVQRIITSHAIAALYDAGFDCGEYSGPAHHRATQSEIVATLDELGWTPDEYDAELSARTSARWAHFYGPCASDWIDS